MATLCLHHAPSSYYSMIARLALSMGEVEYKSQIMDIHRRKQQLASEYARINPHLTVPALETGEGICADSREILAWVIRERSKVFQESTPEVQAILDAHYAFSIERFTFGSAMLRIPLLRWVFPRILAKACRDLEKLKDADPAQTPVFENKIRQNEARIQFFMTGSLREKVAALREEAAVLIASIPTPKGFYLMGEKPSAADVVLAVFWARMNMVGATEVLAPRQDLEDWFARISGTPAYQAADIWSTFSVRRVLQNR
jgi:glutathione S-transferase